MRLKNKRICVHQIHKDGVFINELNKARKESGLKPLSIKIRNCLQCDKQFKSYQPNIRLCPNCREKHLHFFEDENAISK